MNSPDRPNRRKELRILFLCLFVVMTGYGLALPVLPFYIEALAVRGGGIPTETSLHVGVITGIFALAQFFFAPLWGRWSDRKGRRAFFLAGLSGYGISLVLFGMSSGLTMLYVARILGGSFSAAILGMASAYVADLSSEKERGSAMAWLGSSIGLGVVVGPGLGGLLSWIAARESIMPGLSIAQRFSIPFFIGALLSLLALAIAWRWLPESTGREPGGMTGGSSRPEDVTTSGEMTSHIGGRQTSYLALAFIGQFALAGFEGTFALHAKLLAGFGSSRMGWVFMVCGAVMAAAQAAVVGRITRFVSEDLLLSVGFVLMGLGLALLMTTERLGSILMYVGVLALGMALILPNLATLVSKGAGDRQGAALGRLTAVGSLGQAVGPITAALLFDLQVHLPYLSSALLLAAAAIYSFAMLSRPA
ncbi:MAG: MFS transporter [Syntrophales bacterium]